MLSPQALIALEIKGGIVTCHEGLWTYTDRFGYPHTSSEGPFRQAQTGLMGLKKRLEERILAARLSALAFGYGVVLPQTPFNVQSVEWPPEAVIDQPHLSGPADLETWLRRPHRTTGGTTITREEGRPRRSHHERSGTCFDRNLSAYPSLAYRVDALVR